MKKILLFLVFACTLTLSKAQVTSDVLDGIYVKEHVPARKPVPYHFIREADISWSKKIWRIVDLKEKINHPLYYPNEPRKDDRYSLFNLLLWGVQNEGLTVYNTNDDEFTAPMTLEEINMKMGVSTDTTYQEDLETGETKPVIIKKELQSSEIQRLLLKEVWFFDKQRAMLECRIVGICPIRMAEKEATLNTEETAGDEGDEKDLVMTKVFWVYFPAIRPLLANHEVFNANNDAERRTFDDIFFKRRFGSYIFAETNVYENRVIAGYMKGLDALLESERIKDFVFKFEHDLWEY